MEIPVRFLPTQTAAPETFLIRQVLGEGMGPVVAPVNTMVIRAEEPVIVDTGLSVTRDPWLEHVFELVDPADVRWIYLSHDDTDHTGAVFELLDRCPSATVVTNMFSVLRMSADRLLPLDRIRIVNPGESFAAGDRELVALVPPTYDSPTTRGLYDRKTGVYWAADSFAIETSRAVDDIDELVPGEFREGFLQTQRMVSPWVGLTDPLKYARHLAIVRDLRPAV
ncbi:MAG TPA: MBL fold metallo-hydrolase, partial [Acidimicrobiia bacterium]|nr:MBL fold metallo-hydrolase [Acidimicrobiia bacterium]